MGYTGLDEEKQKLLEIFKAFDENGDGQLAYEEIFHGYKQYFNGDVKRAQVEARIIFDKLDFNNNGTIDYSEFLIANLDPSKIVNEDRLREVFDIFDVDRSGAITVDEIKKILGNGNKVSKAASGKLGESMSSPLTRNNPHAIDSTENTVDDAEWDLILGEVDINGDGEISFDEFLDMIFRLFGMEKPNQFKLLDVQETGMLSQGGV